MPSLAPPFDLIIGWAQTGSVSSYLNALATVSYQTYGAGDRVLVFAQVRG